jgi:hypothetical protein
MEVAAMNREELDQYARREHRAAVHELRGMFGWPLLVALLIGVLFGWACEADAEIVRVDCTEVAYTEHWDTSEETLARGGFNSGQYTLGQTFLSLGDAANVEWQAMSGTLPLRLGIKLEGTDLVIHKDSTQKANLCFDYLTGVIPTNECSRHFSTDGFSVGDGRVWITAEGKPTSLNFVPNDETFPRHSWTMYPMVCRPEEHALHATRPALCSQLDPCIDNDLGDPTPCPGTINIHSIGEMRTTWAGSSQEGGGRWGGVATLVLDEAVSNVGVVFNTTFADFPFSSGGIHRNLRVRFYDDALNEVGALVVRSDVEKPRWNPPYTSMFMDGVEQCYADLANQDSIRVVLVDSVDGQRWALRGLYHDPAYLYNASDYIAMTSCEPPIQGLQRDWDLSVGGGTWIRDPSPHVANHTGNWHAWSPDAGDHEAHEQICGMFTDGPESMQCYCSPDEASMLQCCAELVPEPGALAMLVTGGALLLVLRRRRWDSS